MLKPVRTSAPVPVTLPEQMALRPVTVKNTSNKKRLTALAKEGIVMYLKEKGGSLNSAIAEFERACDCLERGIYSYMPRHIVSCVQTLGRIPGRSALHEWVKAYNSKGTDGLVPNHKGGAARDTSWRTECVALYNQPSKPTLAAVHRHLTEICGYRVSYDQVRSFIRNLPASCGAKSPARQGARFHKLNQKSYISRVTNGYIEPGEVWTADGYTADVYLAHPITGDLFRPELTVALDVSSRAVVHWRIDEHEGTYAVQNMWAEAIAKHNHRPLKFYIDNGSGHRNTYMSEELTGFYARIGVEVTHALPGNPHGKGWIERFFRSVKDDFLKMWRPEFYCGDDMAAEVRNKVVMLVKRGKLSPPSIAEFRDAFNAWLERRAARPHPELQGMSIAEKHAEMRQQPPVMSLDEMQRRAVVLTVSRARITQGKRAYKHPSLYEFNGRQVILEFDLMDDRVAVVRTLDGTWICDAHLVEKVGVFENRMEELRQKRLKDQVRRGEKKISEQRARAGIVLDADALVDSALPAITHAPKRLPSSGGDEITLFDI